MDITVQKNVPVSIHQQLVTQLSMQIAGGQLKPGAKLPSVRALANRLGIHYNTCLAVYRELDGLGLVTIRQGSGARVADISGTIRHGAGVPAELNQLSQLAHYFVRQAERLGCGWDDVEHALDAARRRMVETSRPRIAYVDLHADILPLFAAELGEHLSCLVTAVALANLDPKHLPEETIYVVSRYHCAALKEKLDAAGRSASPIVIIDVNSAQSEINLVKQLPGGQLVLVISGSSIVLRQAEAVINALRGQDLLLRTILADEGGQEERDEIRRATRHGRLIFADSLLAPEIRELTDKPVHTLRVIPEPEMDKIRQAIG